MTRDPHSEPAKALHALGIEVVKGDCLDRASLEAAFQGADAVFGVTNPFVKRWTGSGSAQTDTDGEVQQGKNIVDACKSAGVRHLVFASVASAGEKTGIPTFDSKWKVEEYIKASGFSGSTTILAPVGFFENMQSPFAGLKQGSMPGLLKPGTRTQMISTEDIGWFAVNAFENPSEWLGRRLEIAGETATADDQCKTIERVRNEAGQWHVSTPPDFVFKLFIPKAVGSLKKFLEEKGTHVDVEECRKIHPGLMNFEKWLVSQGLDKKPLPSPGWCTVM